MARVDCAQAVRLRMRKTYTFGCMAEHNRRKGTSVMIYHRGASLSEQHTDLLRTKQDLSHTSR